MSIEEMRGCALRPSAVGWHPHLLGQATVGIQTSLLQQTLNFHCFIVCLLRGLLCEMTGVISFVVGLLLLGQGLVNNAVTSFISIARFTYMLHVKC